MNVMAIVAVLRLITDGAGVSQMRMGSLLAAVAVLLILNKPLAVVELFFCFFFNLQVSIHVSRTMLLFSIVHLQDL